MFHCFLSLFCKKKKNKWCEINKFVGNYQFTHFESADVQIFYTLIVNNGKYTEKQYTFFTLFFSKWIREKHIDDKTFIKRKIKSRHLLIAVLDTFLSEVNRKYFLQIISVLFYGDSNYFVFFFDFEINFKDFNF